MGERTEDRDRKTLSSGAAHVATVGDLRELLDSCGLPDAAPLSGLVFSRKKSWRGEREEVMRRGRLGGIVGVGELKIAVDLRRPSA
jgi:hypothetical protein